MMEIKKQNVCNAIKVIVFLMIVALFFLFFTYLMRNTAHNGRQIILDFYEEETSLDMVFIGASPTFRYWDPMRAWEEQGIASRNYAASNMHEATYLSALKDVLRTQNPKVVVIDARRFIRKYAAGDISAGARKMLDSLDYDWERLQAVSYFCEKTDISFENAISLYIDLIQYHDNYEAFTTPLNWQLADNRLGDVSIMTYKGYILWPTHKKFSDPSEQLSDEFGEIDENVLELYTDLIEYGREEGIELLFIATPKIITEGESKKINTLAQVAASYGVDFIDGNRLYTEIGLDFSKDFSDARHTNILGADKFTSYLAKYLKDTYNLPDHRGDIEYASWDAIYEEYIVEAEIKRAECEERIEKSQKAVEAEGIEEGTPVNSGK